MKMISFSFQHTGIRGPICILGCCKLTEIRKIRDEFELEITIFKFEWPRFIVRLDLVPFKKKMY